MDDWHPMITAPRDGRWICVLSNMTRVGVGEPFRACPEIMIIRRERLHPESGGYWKSTAGHSVADSRLEASLWADIDALPIRKMCEASEANRQRQGGEPYSLPVPYGNGLPD